MRETEASLVPLLVTAELPPDILAWADALRKEHYPPARNRLRAHVTLFHGMPPSSGAAVRQSLRDVALANSPPNAQVSGLMDLGRGTAYSVECPEMVALHETLAERWHGLTQQKDARELHLHITVQNKVSREEAKVLQASLSARFEPRSFRFRGFGLYGWDGSLWNLLQVYPFRRQDG